MKPAPAPMTVYGRDGSALGWIVDRGPGAIDAFVIEDGCRRYIGFFKIRREAIAAVEIAAASGGRDGGERPR